MKQILLMVEGGCKTADDRCLEISILFFPMLVYSV